MRVSVLASVSSPADVAALPAGRLPALAAEIRDFLVQAVARTGGHLGPNLGAVELTIALHRVFDSPRDRVVWDTGHQAYVHKLLTGRAADFATLRQAGGLSGYPSRAESEHDVVENSHASTALSWADGLSKAYALRGEGAERCVVAVVGDGALTGGMAWEALNTIAADDRRVVIVVNDNGRSYAPTIGGLAGHLTALRTTRRYEDALGAVRDGLQRTPVVGPPLYDLLHGAKKGLKDVLAPQGLFEDLGLKYVGPVDGHDVAALEEAFERARDFGGPVLVHCVTRKGYGYQPALDDEADNFHGVGTFDPASGRASSGSGGPSWTSVFSGEMVALGRTRPDVVAVTAAMLAPTGLAAFAAEHPERVFDVGIAEQHALTSAAGLALGGFHPVVAVYATFLNRAVDQLLMDVALHRAGVTVVLDRAGVTGPDGASHHGVWDLGLLQAVPGLRLAAPRDGAALRERLREAVDVDDAPTVVRFPRGSVPQELPSVGRVQDVEVLVAQDPDRPCADVLLVAVGAMAHTCMEAATRAAAQGVTVTVVDPCWVLPVPDGLATLARDHRMVVTVEDGVVAGGVGSSVALALGEAGVDVPLRALGVPREFLDHGSRAQVLAAAGLSVQDVARRLVEESARLGADGLGEDGLAPSRREHLPAAERGRETGLTSG